MAQSDPFSFLWSLLSGLDLLAVAAAEAVRYPRWHQPTTARRFIQISARFGAGLHCGGISARDVVLRFILGSLQSRIFVVLADDGNVTASGSKRISPSQTQRYASQTQRQVRKDCLKVHWLPDVIIWIYAYALLLHCRQLADIREHRLGNTTQHFSVSDPGVMQVISKAYV